MSIEQSFQSFTTIKTKRLILRKLKKSDAPQMFDYFSREDVTKFYNMAPFTSLSQAEELIERFLTRFEEGSQVRWGITIKENDTLIGTCGFHAFDKKHQKAEIGYELHPEYWGEGIITEAIQAILQYSFREMKLNRIEALFYEKNDASQKALLKNNFVVEGVLRQKYFDQGEFVNVKIASILKEEWISQKK